MNGLRGEFKSFKRDILLFTKEFSSFIYLFSKTQFMRFEYGKSLFVKRLYRHRGRLAKRLAHSGMAGVTAMGLVVAPLFVKQLESQGINPWDTENVPQVLSASVESQGTETDFSEKQFRDSIIDYEVQDGDTVSSISKKFDVSQDTIRWENNLVSKDSIKMGQTLKILPVTGVSHRVKKGDTVFNIAKEYDAEPQAIVNFPFNTFVNDETFELAVGQIIIVPDGVKKDTVLWQPIARIRQITPDAGTVVASGNFVWPTQGTITQRYFWYHKGVDIANRASPQVLAADSGKVVTAGWSNVGYGNHVIIDHGNGYRTLYAHLSKIYVVVGQSVARGGALGQMGSTGRSTGTHLHFEVIKGSTHINPLSVLK